MNQYFIERTLWYATAEGRTYLRQADLRTRTEPLVILGEAGMGKTTLLEWLADAPGFSLHTARKLVHHPSPTALRRGAEVLVIDALDEVPVQREGDAVGLVLSRLIEMGQPRFILSCRVADWRSATGSGFIRDFYDRKPLELHLTPFSESDAVAYLSRLIGSKTANAVVHHFTARGLDGFLSNPQTLNLVSRIAEQENLPETKNELFERAVDVLWKEHNDAKSEGELAQEAALDTAGAAFAGLILTGNEGIGRTSSANNADGDLHLTELTRLAKGEDLTAVLRTRLFKAIGPDRFSYWHRSIGEYLAARWLRKMANTPRKRRRLLGLFQHLRLVPSSIRGVHAWLALDPALAPFVLAADPLGVIEYGDADDLKAEGARSMLSALSALAIENPRFTERPSYATQGLAHPALLPNLRALIKAADTPVRLRQFVLEAIKGSRIVLDLFEDLRELLLDPNAVFINRSAAGLALIGYDNLQDWPSTMRSLHSQGDELSLRLAIELIDKIGYAQFDDKFIVELVIAYTGHGNRTLGVLFGIERRLPDERLDGVLDRYAKAASALGKVNEYGDDEEVTEFAYELITRRIASRDVDVRRLWSWLKPFAYGVKYGSSGARLASLIKENHSLRIRMFRLVLLEEVDGGSIRDRSWELRNRCEGFCPSADDVITLLELLDPSNCTDERWRDLVQLVAHDHKTIAEICAAARRFACGRPDQLAWIDSLAEPPEWVADQLRSESELRNQQAERQSEQREQFAGQIEAIRTGQYYPLVRLADVYLGISNRHLYANVASHERIAQWLGDDVSDAALLGFESFLTAVSLYASADDIAASTVLGRGWSASHILLAGLAERHRNGVAMSDLDDERLLAGLFELRRARHRNYAMEGLEQTVEVAVRSRGLYPEAMRRFYEPQLKARYINVDVYALMRSDSDAVLATELATEWLVKFPELPAATEAELIDRLILSGQNNALNRIAKARLSIADAERQLNWNAVDLITNFDEASARIDATSVEPNLLWSVRDRAIKTRRRHNVTLTVAQLEWLISRFRTLWPVASPPQDGWSGDRNPWDASEHINELIRRLGNDSSENASAALARLLEVSTDGYTETVQSVAAEQRRIRVESSFTPPTLAVIAAIANDDLPVSAADLQTFLMDELAVVQSKIRSDDAESWRGFYQDKQCPHDENWCRDHLLGLLRQGSTGVTFAPEVHVSSDKEVDIACSVRGLRMPIELKGQWHPQLWRAADTQLAKMYAIDWRADGCGIYLVLWFGPHVPENKRLYSPPRGTELPHSPEQLCDMLVSTSRAALEGRVKVVVLDVSRS